MNDRFVADIGDFGKYGLLRALCDPSPPNDGVALSLGVVWYLTPDAGVQYLKNPDDYRQCDPHLYDALAGMVRSAGRKVASVQDSNILPSGTAFHDDYIGGTPDRDAYLRKGQEITRRCDLVFIDPDNGIGDPNDDPRSPKHCYIDELKPYVDRQQSLVVYQHQPRTQDWVRKGLAQMAKLGSDAFAMRWRRGNARAFLVLPARQHRDRLRARAKAMLQGSWKQHFTPVDL